MNANERPEGPVSARKKVGAWLEANSQDCLILLCLAALTVLVRVLNLEGVGTGGDAIRKWHFVRQWFHANDFSHAKWDHHMARFGVTAVAFVAQVLFGRGPSTYYAPQVFAAVVETSFVFACGKRLESRLAGVLGAFFLIYFKGQDRAASQLMPEIFSGAYSIMAAYFYVRYVDADAKRRLAWLAATGTAAFVAYLGKETSVFFFPGFALAIWMASKRLRDVGIFGLAFLFGVLCETAFYRIHTDYPHRLAVIVGTHITDGPLSETEFLLLFDRYVKLDNPWKFAFYSLIPCTLGVLGFRRDFRSTAVLAMAWSYYFFLTFLVRKVNPVVIWQAFLPRYLDPTAPFVALIIGMFVALSFRAVWSRHETGAARRFVVPPRFVSVPVILLSLAAGAGSYAAERPHLEHNALALNAKMSQIANDTYRRNLPIVAARDPRGVWTVYNVFIDDRLLVQNGKLPLYDDVKQEAGGHTYLVRNPRDYGHGTLSRLMKAGCYVEVSANAGLPIKMTPMRKLAPECDSELRH